MPVSTDIKQIDAWLDRYHALSAEGAKLEEEFYNVPPTPRDLEKAKGELAKKRDKYATTKDPILAAEIAKDEIQIASDDATLKAQWQRIQDLRHEINVLSDSIRESLYLLNEEG